MENALSSLYWISIHALRVEGDLPRGGPPEKRYKFLSTPSGWRATPESWQREAAQNISIHALRVEGDAGELGF